MCPSSATKRCLSKPCLSICSITCAARVETAIKKKLVGAFSAEKMLVYASLFSWYVDHGVVITCVYRTIDYQATKLFTWFVEQVTEARHTGEVGKSKVLMRLDKRMS